VSLSLPGVELTLATDRGMFSPERIDIGTRTLLQTAPVPTGARTVLDLGCGYGPIALTLATRLPQATVWAIDVNDRAVQLCGANAAAAGLTNVRAVAPADVPDEVRFDAIWSNPPIRIGKSALHELLLTWLERLTAQGVATLVVQKHLGSDSLQAWLRTQDWSCERVASRAGYRILEVRRPA
jgi:16S rRNA (guanine1207-N2)-methyltransferase